MLNDDAGLRVDVEASVQDAGLRDQKAPEDSTWSRSRTDVLTRQV